MVIIMILLKDGILLFDNAVMCPKDADGMANCVDPDHCFLRPVFPSRAPDKRGQKVKR